MGKTRRRRTLRGGIGLEGITEAEYFKKVASDRKKDLEGVSKRLETKPAIVENVGQNPKSVSSSASSSRKGSMSSGRRHRKRKHTRRRR